MENSQGDLVQGRTRWRRFAAVIVPAAAAAGILFAGVAQGAIPVTLNVSGQSFKVSADNLDGGGFAQYGGVVVTANGTQIPVAYSAIESATLTNLCQSVKIPNTPLTLLIRAGRSEGNPVTASNLLIGMDHLQGDARFEGIDIGTDSSKLTKGGANAKGETGWFGQQATEVHIKGVKQTAYMTSAGTFTLNGLDLKISFTGEQCFPDFPAAS
jgi:Family of unknown function (DUF6230)